jgi:hypothetical protein
MPWVETAQPADAVRVDYTTGARRASHTALSCGGDSAEIAEIYTA